MILYLPGFSLKNKDELKSISAALISDGNEVISHEWRHWADGTAPWDVPIEISLIKEKMNNQQIDLVIAKSLGTYVAANILWEKLIDPGKIIFLGVPVCDLSEDEKELMQLVIRRVKDKITFVHNSLDPKGTIEDLNFMLLNIDHDIRIKESDTHQYDYPEDILSIINE